MDERNKLEVFLETLFLEHGPEEFVENLSFLMGAFVVSKDGIVLGASEAFLKMVAYERDTLCGMQAVQLVLDRHKYRLTEIFAKNHTEPFRIDLLSRDGSPLHTRVSPHLFYVQNEEYRLAEFIDITETQTAEVDLVRSEEKFKAIFSHGAVGIARIGLSGKWLEVNEKLCEILGYAEEEFDALSFADVTHPADLAKDTALIMETLANKRDSYTLEKRYVRKNGEIIWGRLSISLIRDSQSKPSYIVALIEDISDLKFAEIEMRELNEKLERYSFIDGLTKITNRRMLDDSIAKEWNRSLRAKTALAFIMIDLDHFKNYNDHYGHPQGDECLIRIATILNNIANRSSDVVARYGGEEFAILAPHSNIEQAARLAEICRAAIEAERIPQATTGDTHLLDIVTVSIGVSSLVPSETNSAAELIEAADRRLYKAKDAGRNRVCSN